jgi:secondary thiamine-phosphate synthase enzyme
MKLLKIKTRRREEMIEITGEIQHAIAEDGREEGAVILFVRHTTCGLTVNENADPDVKSDILGLLRRLVPKDEPSFRHFEQNSDAHIKASLVGPSLTIPFSGGRLLLGRWQGIYLCEFDGPREREVVVGILAAE